MGGINAVALNTILEGYGDLGAALKADLKEAVDTGEGPMTAKRLAVKMDKSPEWVWAVGRGEITPSLSDLLTWEQETGGVRGLQWMAAKLGLIVLPFPDGGDTKLKEIADVYQSSAEYVHKLTAIYRDGEVDIHEAKEKPDIEKLCKNVIEASMSLLTKFVIDAEHAKMGRVRTLKATSELNPKE
jgi:hypothetical protein